MNKSLLFNLLCSFACAQDLASDDTNEKSPVSSIVNLAAAAGLVHPTSSWVPSHGQVAKNLTSSIVSHETSREAWESSATSPALNILNHGAEGDIHGAAPRNNYVYFGIGRHGFDVGAGCDPADNCNECGGKNIYENVQPCDNARGKVPAKPYREPKQPCKEAPHNGNTRNSGGNFHNVGNAQRPDCDHHRYEYVPRDNGHYQEQPYLRVTPHLAIKKSTRTETETATSTSLDVETRLRTRTITEKDLFTHTHVFHPVETFTRVDKQTVYEYPASTIDFEHVRAPQQTGRRVSWD